MECEDPVFKAEYVTSVVVADVDTTDVVITDPISTAPHGFKFKITFTDYTALFVIQDQSTPEWAFQINYEFLSGDELYFSSENNDKYLYRVRSAVTVQLMDVVEPGSTWPILFPGSNTFLILADDNFAWNEIFFYETHWGV
jgi:hypothetical protein